jgi:nucleotide-binding universal stress UspA family protein
LLLVLTEEVHSADPSTLGNNSQPVEEEQKFRRILVAINGSERSARALNLAIRMARNEGAELTVLHVNVVSRSFYSGEGGHRLSEIEGKTRMEGERIMTGALTEAMRKGMKPKTALLSAIDTPAPAIVRYARESKIDLVVVGTRGFRGLRRIFIGSIASEIIRDSPCPVLVAR